MKLRDDLNATAIHEAGHVAACINLDLEFDAVYLEPSKEHPGLVAKLAKKAGIDYSSGVLSPEEESLSTTLVIVGFAGPAVDALHRGRTSFDIAEYDDLDEVLDAIEYRFANNNVRIAFTHYCEAEAFALFEDDRRLWRFTHVLARALAREKKLTYAQCMELYSKEYLAESWVRKEVDEIRREGEAKGGEGEDRKEEERLVANYEQRAVSIQKGPKGARPPKREAAGGEVDGRRPHEKGQEPPVQDREVLKHEDVVEGAPEGGAQPAEEGGQQERRNKRRRRGRGRGRGKKREEREEPVLEALPGEVIGGQPVEEPVPPAPKGEESRRPPQEARMAATSQQQSQGGKAARREAEPPRHQGAKAQQELLSDKSPAASETVAAPPAMPAPGETPKEERPKLQVVKAVKPPVSPGTPVETPPAAEGAKPLEAVVPPVVDQRPVEAPPVVVPEVPADPEAAELPKRRLAVSGKKTEGKAVRGQKGTSHPDSIWDEGEKPQASSARPRAERPPVPPAPGVEAEGTKPAKAAKSRTTKAAKTAAPAPAKAKGAVAENGGKPTKAAKAPAPVAQAPVEPKPSKAARPAKAARTKAAAAPPAAPEAPVKKARPAPAKKAAPAKAAPKPAAKKSGGKKKGA